MSIRTPIICWTCLAFSLICESALCWRQLPSCWQKNGSSHSPKGGNKPLFQNYSQESWDLSFQKQVSKEMEPLIGSASGLCLASGIQDHSANPPNLHPFISSPLLPHTSNTSKETFSSLVWETEEDTSPQTLRFFFSMPRVLYRYLKFYVFGNQSLKVLCVYILPQLCVSLLCDKDHLILNFSFPQIKRVRKSCNYLSQTLRFVCEDKIHYTHITYFSNHQHFHLDVIFFFHSCLHISSILLRNTLLIPLNRHF